MVAWSQKLFPPSAGKASEVPPGTGHVAPAAAAAAAAAVVGNGSPSFMDGPSTGFEVGCRLKLKTSLGEELEGEVLVFDASTNCVILQDVDSRGTKRNIRFIKADRIEDFTVVSRSEDRSSLPVPHVDLNFLHAKEEAAIRKAELESERIGVGVTAQAQDVFFALVKTLPCKWEKTTIVVMDEVRVSSPYTPDDVKGGSAAANDRVRKVLARERERLQLSS